MENVADALKIVAAVSIFALACFMLFRVATTAREAAAFSLTEVDRDGYVYMEDSEYIHNGNRLVLWSQVWANIQNYDQRSVGITIIKDDKIIARFDMKTEDTINQWKLIRDENEDGTPNDKEKLVDYYNEYITTPAGITSFDSVEKLEELFEKIYNIKGGGSNDKFLCPWFGNYNETQQRIGCEIGGYETKYQQDRYIHEGVGLKDKYGIGSTTLFEEIIIDTNDEYIYSDEDRLWVGSTETDSDGNTITNSMRGVTRKEYIYIVYN